MTEINDRWHLNALKYHKRPVTTWQVEVLQQTNVVTLLL